MRKSPVPSFVEERFKDKSLSFHPDYSDDCYVTVPDGGDYYEHHNHPPVVNVFPIVPFYKSDRLELDKNL